jgi:hypothetical protein
MKKLYLLLELYCSWYGPELEILLFLGPQLSEIKKRKKKIK